MRKVYLLILSALLAAGCSSGSASSTAEPADAGKESAAEEAAETPEPTPEPEPLDLSGSWEQKDHDPDTYMIAYIDDSSIQVCWMMDGTKYLYWAGTYVAPAESTDTYSWVSENDTEKTEYALLASSAETKEFRYEKECISFEVTVQGVTKNISLERSGNDYSDGF